MELVTISSSLPDIAYIYIDDLVSKVVQADILVVLYQAYALDFVRMLVTYYSCRLLYMDYRSSCRYVKKS